MERFAAMMKTVLHLDGVEHSAIVIQCGFGNLVVGPGGAGGGSQFAWGF
jgi:hypothetical protein